MNHYADVVFMQDDEADEVLGRLCRVEGFVIHGPTAETIREAVEYLCQWDSGEYAEIRDSLPAGRLDEVVFADGGEYVLTYNYGLRYVGLSRILLESAGE